MRLTGKFVAPADSVNTFTAPAFGVATPASGAIRADTRIVVVCAGTAQNDFSVTRLSFPSRIALTGALTASTERPSTVAVSTNPADRETIVPHTAGAAVKSIGRMADTTAQRYCSLKPRMGDGDLPLKFVDYVNDTNSNLQLS